MSGISSLDRYGSLRRRLVRIEQLVAGIDPAQRTQLARSLKQFSIVEAGMEGARASGDYADVDSAKFHRVVSKQIDELERIMIAIRKVGM